VSGRSNIEHRVVDVVRLLQDPLVEAEPGDLPVDEALRRIQVDRGDLGADRQVGFLPQRLYFQRDDLTLIHLELSRARQNKQDGDSPFPFIARSSIPNYCRIWTHAGRAARSAPRLGSAKPKSIEKLIYVKAGPPALG